MSNIKFLKLIRIRIGEPITAIDINKSSDYNLRGNMFWVNFRIFGIF
jgi:hypothetical protein